MTKCLPFGASISCALFQEVSDAIKHIVEVKTKSPLTNYLDDFLFYALLKARCHFLLSEFMKICGMIGVPIALDKTEWSSEQIIFLGILLDGINFVLSIPLEKRERAVFLLQTVLQKRKVTVKQLQTLCGYLNFLTKAVVPGRVFTRRMYAKFSGEKNMISSKQTQTVLSKLKQYHHVKLDAEFKRDCQIWLSFLTDTDLAPVVNRPMIDLEKSILAEDIGFYSDASAAIDLGFGSILGKKWIFGQWGRQFMKQNKPSIEYPELFALCAGILTWDSDLNNCRIIVHCDNQAVVHMVNSTTSSCRKCMKLLRILVLNNMRFNRRVFARWLDTKSNFLADSLSRMDLIRFRKLGPNMNQFPDHISPDLWPISKVWED